MRHFVALIIGLGLRKLERKTGCKTVLSSAPSPGKASQFGGEGSPGAQLAFYLIRLMVPPSARSAKACVIGRRPV
jgi:hypothetical protein